MRAEVQAGGRTGQLRCLSPTARRPPAAGIGPKGGPRDTEFAPGRLDPVTPGPAPARCEVNLINGHKVSLINGNLPDQLVEHAGIHLDIEAILAVGPRGESPGSVLNQVLEPDLVRECRNSPNYRTPSASTGGARRKPSGR